VTPQRCSPNTWQVIDDTGTVIAGPFKTNAAAWRWIDRQNGEPISRSEDVGEWIAFNSFAPTKAALFKSALLSFVNSPQELALAARVRATCRVYVVRI
jgi:hypothetical protein